MSNTKTVYLPGLNGIRAIAAIGVLMSHTNLDLHLFNIKFFSLFGFNEAGKQLSWSLGEQGVTMFFVLSGFLITYLLVLEQNKTHTINRKKFYIRRILRIWPLYFLYFSIAVLTYFIASSQMPSFEISLMYIFLLANLPFILNSALPLCAHLWSIAVEEQFYLFWPFLFRKKLNLVKILSIIIAASIIIRILLWIFFPFQFITILFTTNRFDCMMFGGLIAILYLQKSFIIKYIQSTVMQSLSWIIVLVHIFNFEIINSIVSLELITLATGIIICAQISSKNKIINLEQPILNFLGKYSFGIYVYHPLIIFLLAKSNLFNSIENEVVRAVIVFISILLITILIAYVSYEMIEKRFIKMKHQFSIIQSTNSSKTTH